MKKNVICLFAAAVFMQACTSGQQDAEQKDVIDANPSAEVSALKLANEMIKYGYEQQSALSLLSGAQILLETEYDQLREKKDGPAVDESEGEKKSRVSYNIESILNDATEMAEGDENVQGIATELGEFLNVVHRGAVGGPKRTIEKVRANSTDTYTINFIGGRLAEIVVSGDGDTDLDLYVYDSSGNLIEKDDDYTDDCYVSWYPKWTGKFIVKVVNRGGVWNEYVIVTN